MTDTAPLGPGEVLGGKYRIERVIGSGGMGVVVEATHLELETRVAIKFLRPTALQSTAAAARLIREARATARISSDHVARVIDAGTLEPDSPYIVMDLLEGKTLAAVLQTKEPFEIEEAVTYVLQACQGIAQAHAIGIVHRDLKPSNIFLAEGPDGSTAVKVLDFGLSKILDDAQYVPRGGEGPLTGTTDVFGSPFYMSPEQLRSSRDVDGRTDIWAIGVLLFEILTGRRPFQARSLPQLCMLISHGQAQPVRQLRPDVPEEIEAVIERCLAKNPAKRFATVQDLASALLPFAAHPVPSSILTLAESRRRTGSRPIQAGRSQRRRPLWLAGGFAGSVVVAAALGYHFHRTHIPPLPSAIEARTLPPAACGNLGTTPCSSCVAANCCAQYQACEAVPACRQALDRYNGCMHHPPSAGAATCSEQFGTDANAEARALAKCAFVSVGGPAVTPGRCVDQCEHDVIGDNACVAYCNCMATTCRATLDPEVCPSACGRMSAEQVECRAYHCFLASRSHPEIHCEHAIGHLGMCP